ncbi:MAG TPA: TMEM165/GDT1 family protein [Alphaproteobacteria bacterium]|nr:TMEM165/GDT1 family protein [Alphaproteobacteria bacterium]
MIEAFFASTAVVALAEIGDKTQLLALLLAGRFRRPVPILAGMLLATLANHAIAGALGAALGDALESPWFRLFVALSFFAVALWALRPDRLGEGISRCIQGGMGAFIATFVSFFCVEIGDKTQVATVALAAHYRAVVPVVAGTTLGMFAANLPVVLLGEKVMKRVPERAARVASAVLFAVMGILALLGAAGALP